jgi:putative flippase GtrA
MLQIKELVKRSIRRALFFSVIGGLGFLAAEAIIYFGVRLTGLDYIVPINVVAALTSVSIGFFLNEHLTVRGEGDHTGGPKGVLYRLLKFQLIFALGNAISISVQLLLLNWFGVIPVIGNIVGAIVAFPVNYSVSMLYVWKIRP